MSNFHLFTDADRDACLPTIDFLLECAEVARNEGLLFLDEFVHEHDNYFLKFVMSMISDMNITLSSDAPDREEIKNIAANLINSQNYKGKKLLECLIIIEAILAIQAGSSHRILEMKLLAYLGEDYLKKRGFSHPTEDKPPVYSYFLVRLHTTVPEHSLQECKEFENTILNLCDDDLRQKILMETEQRWWAKALKGCGEAVAKKIENHLSRRLEHMISEDIQFMGEIDVSEILDAQNKILNVISRLAGKGDIPLNV